MYKRKYLKCLVPILLIGLSSCHLENEKNLIEDSPKAEEINAKSTNVSIDEKKEVTINVRKKVDSLNNQTGQISLVDIQTINSSIQVDLKYATTDNFMKIRLYDTLTKAYLQKEVAERLGRCQAYLSSIDKNLFLLIYDAVRPVSVQQKMWDALDSIPVSERGRFVSNPVNGSLHNYGAAVDITICDSRGVPLNMGAGYDDIRKIAYPSLEAQFLKSGELTQQQLENRKLLRKVMASQNFRNIPSEWWHFNAFSRKVAKAKYVALK